MAGASRVDADWKKNVPPELIPAVEHIRSMFADTDSKSRQTTEVFCYAALHPADAGATEEAEPYLPTLEHLLRHRVSTATLQTFEQLTNKKTPPSVLHAYFVLYQQVLKGQCKAAWGDLLRIAPAGPIQQRIEWAEAHVKGLIQHAKCNVAKWLMGCCDGHVSRTDATSLAWMRPALNKPYEPTKTWKRESIEDTQQIKSFFEMGLECCLRTELQVWSGVAHLEAAKQPKPVQDDALERKPQTSQDSPIATQPFRSEAREADATRKYALLKRIKPAKPEGCFRTEEAAVVLGVSARTINRRVRDGDLTKGPTRSTVTASSVKRAYEVSFGDIE